MWRWGIVGAYMTSTETFPPPGNQEVDSVSKLLTVIKHYWLRKKKKKKAVDSILLIISNVITLNVSVQVSIFTAVYSICDWKL